MGKEILKCIKCGEFTLKEKHCELKTISPKPMRYSPLDKWGKYRLIQKKKLGIF